jgi:alpha-tubulin suppressor-like RCC1 family protein
VLTANGGLLTWGSNEFLALAHSKDAHPPFRLLPRVPRGLPPATRVLHVSCGATHTLALSAAGEVYAAGSGARGALGLGDREARGELTRVGGCLAGVPIAAVCAGDGTSHALSLSGLAYAWGGNRHSQFGLPCSGAAGHALLAPARVPLPELALTVTAGKNHTLWGSRSGRLYAAGLNKHGQCGLGLPAPAPASTSASAPSTSTSEDATPPWCAQVPTLVPLPGAQRVREVAAGERHTLILTVSGDVFAMGDYGSSSSGSPCGSPRASLACAARACSSWRRAAAAAWACAL